MRPFPFAFGALTIAACASNATTTPGPVDVRIVLAPGESAAIDGAGTRVRFEGVSGDSRCPTGAVCVWAGDAIVRIEVHSGRGAQAAFELHTADSQPVRHGDLALTLETLSPYPVVGRPIVPTDYRATIRIAR